MSKVKGLAVLGMHQRTFRILENFPGKKVASSGLSIQCMGGGAGGQCLRSYIMDVAA